MTEFKFKVNEILSGGPEDTGTVLKFVPNWKMLASEAGVEIYGLGDIPKVSDRILVEDDNWMTYWRVVEVHELNEPSNYHWSVKVRRGSHANLKALSRLKMSDT